MTYRDDDEEKWEGEKTHKKGQLYNKIIWDQMGMRKAQNWEERLLTDPQGFSSQEALEAG